MKDFVKGMKPMMRGKIVKNSLAAIGAALILMNAAPVYAAELTDEMQIQAETEPVISEELSIPQEEQAIQINNEAMLLLAQQTLSADSATAALQAAQMQIALQGIALDKYHNINVLGDSITEGVGARTPDKAYPVILSKLTGANVNNYGVSCSRITDIDSNVSNPGSFIDRMYDMDKTADLVIVFGGTNDFWFGDCPIGSRTDTSVSTFYGALNTMIPYLKGAHPDADLVFVVPYQQSKDADETHSYKRSTYGDFGTGTLNQYRIAMLDRCQFYGVPVLDLYADFDLNTVDNREALEKYGNYLCDGCHLNDAGYNLLARKIYQFIMQDLSMYVPLYTEINDMIFETAALPAMIQNGSFVMPNGQVIASKPEFEVDPTMPLLQLYQYLMHNVQSDNV